MATEEQREAFRQALRHTREQRGLTQRALSRIIGLTNSAVWQWEQGRAIPRPEIVAKLEAALDLGPGVLSRLMGYLPTMDVLDALQADPKLGARERKLLATFYRELVAQREASQGG